MQQGSRKIPLGRRMVQGTILHKKCFWRSKPLAEMSFEEWESICDGCGLCCLIKLEDDNAGKIYYTNVACRLLDISRCRCEAYDDRYGLEPNCLALSPAKASNLDWLPVTCAYRLVAEGKDLPWWHHLICGDNEMVHKAGISLRGRAVREDKIPPDKLGDYLVDWVAYEEPRA